MIRHYKLKELSALTTAQLNALETQLRDYLAELEPDDPEVAMIYDTLTRIAAARRKCRPKGPRP